APLREVLEFGVLVHRVDVVLPGPERDGRDAVPRDPVGVEAAVAQAQRHVPAGAGGRRLRPAHHRAVFLAMERIIITARLEADAGRAAALVRDLFGRGPEGVAVGGDDVAHEAQVVAARLAADQGVIGDDVGRHAGAGALLVADAADVGGAFAAVPADL